MKGTKRFTEDVTPYLHELEYDVLNTCETCVKYVPSFFPMDGEEMEGEPTGSGECLLAIHETIDEVSHRNYCGYQEAKN